MADLVQVADALVQKIADIVYPNGITSPSVTGVPIVVYQGWPLESNLSEGLKAGKVHVSVFSQPNEKILPVTIREWVTVAMGSPTVTATASGNSINIGGAVTTPFVTQHIAVVVDNLSVSYPVKPTDTLSTITTNIFNLIAPYYGSIQIINNSIILPESANLRAVRVGITGTAKRLVRRQEKGFHITIWANCFDSRDPIAELIDAELAGTDRLLLADGSLGILRYRSSTQDDSLQRQGTYRRDLFYTVEYATYQTQTQTQITSTEVDIYAVPDGDTQTLLKTVIN